MCPSSGWMTDCAATVAENWSVNSTKQFCAGSLASACARAALIASSTAATFCMQCSLASTRRPPQHPKPPTRTSGRRPHSSSFLLTTSSFRDNDSHLNRSDSTLVSLWMGTTQKKVCGNSCWKTAATTSFCDSRSSPRMLDCGKDSWRGIMGDGVVSQEASSSASTSAENRISRSSMEPMSRMASPLAASVRCSREALRRGALRVRFSELLPKVCVLRLDFRRTSEQGCSSGSRYIDGDESTWPRCPLVVVGVLGSLLLRCCTMAGQVWRAAGPSVAGGVTAAGNGVSCRGGEPGSGWTGVPCCCGGRAPVCHLKGLDLSFSSRARSRSRCCWIFGTPVTSTA
mmetsp:Transcript_41526/g.106217  ORF Transcript_41526/g.106217 Transcript_41526/m.106217 type:complete len:343 (-) Transcript_41526:729-1757(-)